MESHKHLSAFLDRLQEVAPLQRRSIDSRLPEYGPQFLDDAEKFFEDFSRLLSATGISLDEAVEGYVGICAESFREQVKFSRSGKYSVDTFAEANTEIYGDYKIMSRYMLGLATTQYLWLQHYQTLQFFRDTLAGAQVAGRYLEIGPGHGFYLLEALRKLGASSFEAVDVSQASADFARHVVSVLHPRGKDISFHVRNILEWAPAQLYDFITMGEVLEHVDEPLVLLRRVGSFLTAGGSFFMTTCANCPAIDHVYLFKSVDEIRGMIAEAGYKIAREHIIERDYGMRTKNGAVIYTTQYAAVLKRS